ncbi:heterokaryon incompatibility protein-domain-containing protein [Cercophora newfieldiana]|uniref:Heterokaryon incompatibility protein-domain-containing protein n=1 Tax=Cercophora newfieldiana TaxID=92897 RepID=A0AA40CI43_9PEZI|nr:heterokaryon incompatibility protein-domain-containing protein [Cercophora newfieldiana]
MVFSGLTAKPSEVQLPPDLSSDEAESSPNATRRRMKRVKKRLSKLLPLPLYQAPDKQVSSIPDPGPTPEALVNEAVSSGNHEAVARIISNTPVPHEWNIDIMAESLRTLIENEHLSAANELLRLMPSRLPSADPDVDRALDPEGSDFGRAYDLLRQGHSPIKRELVFLNATLPYSQARINVVDGYSDFITTLCRSLSQKPELPQAPNVCASCEEFLTADPPTPYHMQVARLQAASKLRGCVFCASFLDVVGVGVESELEDEVLVIKRVKRPHDNGHNLEFIGSREGQAKLGPRLPIGGHSETPDRSGTGDEFSIQWTQKMLLWCLTNHATCINATETSCYLPRRVIDVGFIGDCGSQDPVLVHSDGRRGIYMTLSHRWTGDILQTTQSNLTNMLSGIPWATLTKTMQDAITVTRALGIRYLWIDSLCIIQDLPSDWALEAAKMAAIYRGSLLNIAADCSHNHADGFLRQLPQQTRRLYVRSSGSDPTSLDRIKMYYSSPFKELRGGALNTRGWILQEKILSVRTVAFDHVISYFSCSHGGSTFIKGVLALKRNGDAPSARHNSYAQWRLVVEEYSRRALTRKSDKLAAVAGVADFLGEALGRRCIAGLWEEELWRDLTWRTHEPGRIKYPIPSWSWACVDSSVSYDWYLPGPKRLEESGLRLLEAEVGAMTSVDGVRGRLLVEGRMFEAVMDERGCLLVGAHGGDSEPSEKKKIPMMKDIFSLGADNAGWFPDVHIRLPRPRGKVWLLGVAETSEEMQFCLCLLPAGPATTPEYRRVGICQFPWTMLNLRQEGKVRELALV